MNEIKMNLYSDFVLFDLKAGIPAYISDLKIPAELYESLIKNNEDRGYVKGGVITDSGTRHLRSKYMNLL